MRSILGLKKYFNLNSVIYTESGRFLKRILLPKKINYDKSSAIFIFKIKLLFTIKDLPVLFVRAEGGTGLL